MTYDLTTIGEGQLRLTAERGMRLGNSDTLRLSPAGSEANVAGMLAQLGRRTAWASKLPEGDLATRFLDEYRGVGVDLSHVRRVPEGRMALYFMEPAEAPLSARVTYDREGTAFREITPSDFDWDALLDTRVVFFTGITAALTDNTAAVVTHAVQAAAERGTTVVLDVNFRAMLWSADQARSVLEPLLEHLDVLFCSRADGRKVFGMDGDADNPAEALRQRYGIDHVVSTDGTNGVHYAGLEGVRSFPVRPVPVVDRPGAGDSFVAGTIHGLLGDGVVTGVGYGIRASAFALTHFGDLTRVTEADLLEQGSADIVR